MLDKNQYTIPDMIMNARRYVPMGELEAAVNLSSRRIRTLISDMNYSGDIIQNKRGSGYYIPKDKEATVRELLMKEEYYIKTDQDASYRQSYIATRMILSETPVSLQTLADELFVSKTTLAGDMKDVLKWMKAHSAKVTIDRRGHSVSCERMDCLLACLLYDYLPSPMAVDHLLFEITGDISPYNDIMQAFRHYLLNNYLHLSDRAMVYFSNILTVNHLFFDEDDTIDDDIADFRTFMNDQCFDLRIHWPRIADYFRVLVLRDYPQTTMTTAAFMAREFRSVVNTNYRIDLSDMDIDALTHILCAVMCEDDMMMPFSKRLTRQVKTTCPFAYEVSMNFFYLFKAVNRKATPDQIAAIALYVRTIIIHQDEKPVDVLVVTTASAIVSDYLSETLRHILARTDIELTTIPLYEFYAMMKTLRPETTIVVDIGTHVKKACEDFGLTYVYAGEMLKPGEVEAIQHAIGHQRVMARKNAVVQSFESLKDCVCVSCEDKATFGTLSTTGIYTYRLVLEDGIEVRQSRGSDNRMDIHVCVESRDVLIWYEIVPEDVDLFTALLNVEEALVRLIRHDGLMNHRDDPHSYLRHLLEED